jgi:hypothetical protein
VSGSRRDSSYTAASTGARIAISSANSAPSASSSENAIWNSRSCSTSSCCTNASSIPTRLSAISVITVIDTIP